MESDVWDRIMERKSCDILDLKRGVFRLLLLLLDNIDPTSLSFRCRNLKHGVPLEDNFIGEKQKHLTEIINSRIAAR